MATYVPRPVDTSRIELRPELKQLLERLAENTHDTWAAQRIKEGWSRGPQRDDAKKEHPGLVPYAELSDSEKEYDRITASETLKLIMQLGFDVVPSPAKVKSKR